jgi:hypothetical protein
MPGQSKMQIKTAGAPLCRRTLVPLNANDHIYWDDLSFTCPKCYAVSEIIHPTPCNHTSIIRNAVADLALGVEDRAGKTVPNCMVVKPSTLLGAGNGLFAVQNIAKDTLMGMYITPHERNITYVLEWL